MRTLRLILEYDGSGFEGWQIQTPGTRTVQGVLTDAVRALSGEEADVLGAGRTDAGVHAEAQAAALRLEMAIEPEALRRALNTRLPADLAVRSVEVVGDAFHPIRDARAKHYRYVVWNGEGRSPLRAQTQHHVGAKLDLAALQAGARELVGTHDFRAFMATGSAARTTERTIHAFDVSGEPGAETRFEVEGSGFLRHMVRIAVGTLLEVGRGRRESAWVREVLAGRDRAAAGPTVPACGLTLVRVDY